MVYVNSIYPLGLPQIVNLKNGDCFARTYSTFHVLLTDSPVRRFSFSLCYAASALITENARDFSFFIRKRKYDDILSLLDPILYSSLESQDLFGRYVRGMGIEFVIINCAQPAGEFPN